VTSALAETIAAQGELVEKALELPLDAAVEVLEPASRIWLVGTGTSQHAAELGAAMLATAPSEVQWRSSAAFVYEAPALSAADAVVIISHTGETAFARTAREHALRSGARLASITGQGAGWPEAIETVPRERSETYTASYLAALVVLARLAVALGRASFDSRALEELPDRVRTAAALPPLLTAAPERLLVLAGAGPGAVSAREGALKLREAARLPAEGYEAEYLLHGSAVPLHAGDAFVAIQPSADRSGLLGLLTEAAGEAGVPVSRLEEPDGLDPVLMQVPLTVRLQVLASRLALARGVDPDHVIQGTWADERLWRAGES
jgi:glucosamine--fructose-6-phosphate aminotransferase (isomerizing)